MVLTLLCIISLVFVPVAAEANPVALKDKPAQSKIFQGGPPIFFSEINRDWVPQGLSYLSSKDWLLISYYYWNEEAGKNSIIAMVDRENKNLVKKVKLLKDDGKPHTGHVGGITVSNKYLWVASTVTIKNKKTGQKKKEYHLLKYPLDQLIKQGNNTTIRAQEDLKLSHKVSYVIYHEKKDSPWIPGIPQVCIGTHESKKNGTLYCYNLDKNENKSSKPDFSIATPDHVQGAEFVGKDDRNLHILYSRSFGRNKNSKLDVYKVFGFHKPAKNPVKVKTLTLFSMSQGIVKVNSDNQLYVNYESGANKYSDGIKQTTHLYFGDITRIITK